MNFKLTWLKVIVSLLVGVLIGYRIGWIQSFTGWMFYPGIFVISTIILILVIYSIWSLIQKK